MIGSYLAEPGAKIITRNEAILPLHKFGHVIVKTNMVLNTVVGQGVVAVNLKNLINLC